MLMYVCENIKKQIAYMLVYDCRYNQSIFDIIPPKNAFVLQIHCTNLWYNAIIHTLLGTYIHHNLAYTNKICLVNNAIYVCICMDIYLQYNRLKVWGCNRFSPQIRVICVPSTLLQCSLHTSN